MIKNVIKHGLFSLHLDPSRCWAISLQEDLHIYEIFITVSPIWTEYVYKY